ncbi:alpha/beta fold hydrolase [Nocardia sp. SYP-A9097]|uniref:alpha/beta fold hydrolase n=1 Tax=Nocardia sp. SYP-A9097 TaxID=2663237 RepID=UPI00129AFF90|nr:alpha/beta hydrolase [Nocardia sp. SYP-A9097]MRH90119.1 alpha/beta fold hydrolase [Nocardia sp. SYP-A9097]
MTTSTVISKDGTVIAYDKIGDGPAVLLVDGAFCHRAVGPSTPVAKELSDSYTVYTYDRRGRGESGDTQPYDPQCEIEDLASVAAEAGAPVSICAFSTGVPLVLEAVRRGLDVDKLGLYEFPLITDDARKPVPADYHQHLRDLITAEKRGAAIKYFMHTGVGVPAPVAALFPLMPGWTKLKKTAHTLPYDNHFLADALDGNPIPSDRYTYITAPTTVFAGSKSPQWMRNGNTALAHAIPTAYYAELPGQTRQVKPRLFTSTLKNFLAR